MVKLKHTEFCELMMHEFYNLRVSFTKKPRRIGAIEQAEQIMQYIKEDMDYIVDALNKNTISARRATISITDLMLELTSFLFASGVEHSVWRHWAAWVALGKAIENHFYDAALYSTLAGEWFFLQNIPHFAIKSLQISDQVLGGLLGCDCDLLKANDEYSEAWIRLFHSIPTKDHSETENSLKAIANFWIEETEQDWQMFHPRSYPDFETSVCAVAAIARHQNFIPQKMTMQQYSFLEAGLAIPEPSPHLHHFLEDIN